MKPEPKGILPSIASPCAEDDTFLPDEFARLATWLYEEGVHGLYACAGTGQGYLMRPEERRLAAEITCEISEQFNGLAIIHVGALQTRDAMELAAHAAQAGAYAVATLLPPRCSQDELVSYCGDVARAAQLPLFIYHSPGLGGHRLGLAQVLELLDIEGVAGLKLTSFDLYFMKQLLVARPNTVVFSGSDEFVLPGLLYGAHGAIGMIYNLVPKLFVAIWDAFQAGDILKAMALQEQEMLLSMTVDQSYGLWCVLARRLATRGFGPYCTRRPRTVPDKETTRRMDSDLAEHLTAIERMLQGE